MRNYAILFLKEVESMPQIIPIKDMRNTSEVSRLCHEKREPIFVTKQGYGDLVVMSIETYNRLIGIAQVDSAITYAEAELAAGAKPIEARAALDELRRKHFE